MFFLLVRLRLPIQEADNTTLPKLLLLKILFSFYA